MVNVVIAPIKLNLVFFSGLYIIGYVFLIRIVLGHERVKDKTLPVRRKALRKYRVWQGL